MSGEEQHRPLDQAPVVAEVVRSGFVESVHHGIVVVSTPEGGLDISLGPVGTPILPRSSLKPLQAVALLRAGARLRGELLALAAASHSGQGFHREGAQRILASSGLTPEALQNTPDLPTDPPLRRQWIAAGRQPESLAQNCSGKHAGMLAACCASGWPLEGYLHPTHALQRFCISVIQELTGETVAAITVDGCGAPAFAVTPIGLARAFGRLASADPDTPEGQVAAAMRDYPRWLGGDGRDVTTLIAGVPGLIAKDGAESVYAAGLSDGHGIAIKITDGGERVRAVVLTAVLRRLGAEALGNGVAAVLDQVDAEATVLGHGKRVGRVLARPVA